MNTNLIMTGALALTMVGTGCATKKYVAKTMAPVEARVTGTEAKNADQDKTITAQGQEIDTLQTNLSRANERIGDVDSKATAAGQSAERANTAAGTAQRTADGATTAATTAQRTADGATTAATSAMARANDVEKSLSRKVDAAVTMKMAESETVLFATNQFTLSKDAKESLDAFAAHLRGKERFVIEVQGFTDKTGSPEANTVLSQRRAETVARYLVNEHDIPLHMVTTLGSGYHDPAGDDKTRDGRKQNRRVEVRLFEPEMASLTAQN
jgi:outer membrane protein OmpA-like peptidoglycan-associated protein